MWCIYKNVIRNRWEINRKANIMGFYNAMNEKIKKMTVLDIGLVKWSVFFSTIIIVKLFPRLLNINYAVLFVLVIACAAKPVCKVWIKK